MELIGAEGAEEANALVYLRISLAGIPALLVTMARTGYLRGLQDTRTPLPAAGATVVLRAALWSRTPDRCLTDRAPPQCHTPSA